MSKVYLEKLPSKSFENSKLQKEEVIRKRDRFEMLATTFCVFITIVIIFALSI